MLIVAFLLILLVLLYIFNKNRRNKIFNKDKSSKIYTWMSMSNEDRNSDNIRTMIESMNRKKRLLNDIQKEYKKIEHNNN
tara:strand:- start:197 stop:436 length:240 start_codon:yes stop_codon:yes gene_type:complete